MLFLLHKEDAQPVETQGDLWLVCVEMVASYAGYGLYMCVVLL